MFVPKINISNFSSITNQLNLGKCLGEKLEKRGACF